MSSHIQELFCHCWLTLEPEAGSHFSTVVILQGSQGHCDVISRFFGSQRKYCFTNHKSKTWNVLKCAPQDRMGVGSRKHVGQELQVLFQGSFLMSPGGRRSQEWVDPDPDCQFCFRCPIIHTRHFREIWPSLCLPPILV